MLKGWQHTILAGVLVLMALPVWASVIVNPVSYDMPNGYTGTWSYFDDTYSGAGNRQQNGAFLSGGLGQLTDGIVGTDYWADNLGNGNAYEWVGWGWHKTPSITFDLGKSTDLETFSVFVNNAQRGGVSIFDTCTLSFSDDGAVFTDPIAYTTTTEDRANRTARFIDIDTPRTAQYVQANFTSWDYWIFISEAKFTAVPEPATLLLLSLGGLGLIRRRSSLSYRK